MTSEQCPNKKKKRNLSIHLMLLRVVYSILINADLLHDTSVQQVKTGAFSSC